MFLASLELTSGIGALISIVVLGSIFLFWIVSLFLLVGDSISFGAKILWFIALTCLAPFAIPLYFLARARRAQAPAPAR
jgi:hypothetical protein